MIHKTLQLIDTKGNIFRWQIPMHYNIQEVTYNAMNDCGFITVEVGGWLYSFEIEKRCLKAPIPFHSDAPPIESFDPVEEDRKMDKWDNLILKVANTGFQCGSWEGERDSDYANWSRQAEEARSRLKEAIVEQAQRIEKLEEALRAISPALADGDGGPFWPARAYLKKHDIYDGDLNDLRVLDAVARAALEGK